MVRMGSLPLGEDSCVRNDLPLLLFVSIPPSSDACLELSMKILWLAVGLFICL